MSKLIPKENDPFRSILIFGPPGSGKGTLGKFLSSAGNHYHLSSGAIFRGLSPDSAAGKIFHKYAVEGKLVPDEVTIEIWHNFVGGLIATNCYYPHDQFLLLDGLPRTVRQTELIDPYIDLMHIIVLETPDVGVLINRLKRRAVIERRQDDFDEDVLRMRMQVYEEKTVKVLEEYPQELISTFNANQPPLDVLRDVLVKLSYLLTHSKS